MQTADVIDRLKEVLEVTKDAELAKALGKHRNYVFGLRQRDSIPYEECIKVAHENGASLDWLLLGKKDGSPGEYYSTETDDPRAARIVGFVTNWQQTKVPDELAWLEQHLRRTVPEYADWYAKHQTAERDDDQGKG